MDEQRPATAIDAVAERHLETVLRLQPTLALSLGVPDAAAGLGDRSPAGLAAVAAADRATLAALDEAERSGPSTRSTR